MSPVERGLKLITELGDVFTDWQIVMSAMSDQYGVLYHLLLDTKTYRLLGGGEKKIPFRNLKCFEVS